MRKTFVVFGILSFLLLYGCSNVTTSTTEESSAAENSEQQDDDTNVKGKAVEKEEKVKGTIDSEDFSKMYSDPKSYENYEIEYTGLVFVEPERDDEGVYLQVYAKPENYEHNVIVGFQHPDFDVNIDDYVEIKGIVKGEFEGENYLGGALNAPMIEATDVKVVDYITAVSPTIKTIEIDEKMEQHGVEISLQKVELAENQTRLYVEVMNNTDNTVYYDSYSAKLILGDQQLETIDDYESDLPEIPYEIVSGVKSEGVLTFPPVDEDIETFTFRTEGHSDNYNIDFKPFVFEIEF